MARQKRKIKQKKKVHKKLKSRIRIKKKDVYEDSGLNINVDSLPQRDPSYIRSNSVKFKIKVKKKR